MDRPAQLTFLMLVLFSLVSPLVSEPTDVGCAAVEKFDEALDSAIEPATVIREYPDVYSASDCFMKCCSLEQDDCNTASFIQYDDQTVCVVARCTPFENCVWVPYQDAVSASIERNTASINATGDTDKSDADSKRELGDVTSDYGTDGSGSDEPIIDADIQGDDDLLTQWTDAIPSTKRIDDDDASRSGNSEFDDALGAIFDDETGSENDHGTGSVPFMPEGNAHAHDKRPKSAWHVVFNKPLVPIVSCIVVIFFLAVIVFLFRYMLGMRDRAVYKPLIDRFTTVSYSD